MDARLIKKAISEAQKSKERHKIGAVVFKGSRIISSAFNELRYAKKLARKYKKFEFSLHAETKAILRARKDLRNHSILVVRVNKQGEFLLAKPCKYCMAYLEYVGIKTIYYSTKEGICTLNLN